MDRQGRGMAGCWVDGSGLRRSVQALHPQHADGVDLRRLEHAVRHLVHDRGRLHAGAERPCPRRLSLQLDAAAPTGRARRGAVLRVLPAGHRGASLRGMGLRDGFLADRRAFQRDRGGAADLPVQVHDPAGGGAGAAARRRRDRTLHHLPADRGLAEPARRRVRDRRRRGAAGAQRIRRRRIAQGCDRTRAGHRGDRTAARHGRRPAAMSDPALGLLMLALIVVVIMMGFPTAFTLMGLGMFFGFFAYYRSGVAWGDNHIFDLMVQRTYGAMTNDVLISIPLFVLMGYVMERGALVDKMFYSIQLAFRHVPASLAVATLIVCTFWGIASGLVGAVVVLMGVIAFNPMLKAGYDVKLASGVITAGGTLGILIPPSVMIIVYAAVAGQSVVKLYAAAMFPGFLLAFLYLLYVVGWAVLNPRIAPKLPESKTRVPVRPWIIKLQQTYSRKMLPALVAAVLVPARVVNVTVEGVRISYLTLLKSLGHALVPLALTLLTLGITWWYVVIHQQPDIQSPATAAIELQLKPGAAQTLGAGAQPTEENLEELGGGVRSRDLAGTSKAEALQQMGSPELRNRSTAAPAESGPAREFYIYFASVAGICCLLLAYYYWIMEAEQFEVLRLLITSVMPLAILTVVVLAVILFGITTATESAAIGAAGAFLLAY